jgi:tetratricopeptide (TPR) repeat protein
MAGKQAKGGLGMDKQMTAGERYEHGLVLKRVQMFHQAIDDFRKASVDPHYTGKAQVQIALCLSAAGRPEEAVMAFRQGLATRTFSPEEEHHILYHMGQTLESLGRYEECLKIYAWIKKEDPGFGDLEERMKHLRAGGSGPVPSAQGSWQTWIDEVCTRGRQLKPQMVAVLEQAGQWLSRKADGLMSRRVFETQSADALDTASEQPSQAFRQKPQSHPAPRDRRVESRRHPRVPVRLRNHFSSRGRTVAGEGELRDLSPWGCRVRSSVAVLVGADLECCIFPQDAANPFIIDSATVRWTSPQEFGLVFTNIRPGVQRQISQLCRTQAA